ncbi:MAG: DUF3137 domain-containing protein [Clostridiales bacterium]|nr:DUF3137 domain-containing protein [Clostridiales bacterium]
MALFGPPLKEVWQQLAVEVNASYVKGGFAKSARVEKSYNNWIILLDTYTVNTGKSSVTYTRMRVPYIRENDIQFKLSRKNIFSGIGRMFGMPLIETYDYDFDDEFVLKGNDETVIKEIFQNQSIKDMIKFQKRLILKVKPYKVKKSLTDSELYFQMTGVLKDMDKLKSLFNLFSALMDELVKNGVASAEKPSMVI